MDCKENHCYKAPIQELWFDGLACDPQKGKALLETPAQCTLTSSDSKGAESTWISGVTYTGNVRVSYPLLSESMKHHDI